MVTAKFVTNWRTQRKGTAALSPEIDPPINDNPHFVQAQLLFAGNSQKLNSTSENNTRLVDPLIPTSIASLIPTTFLFPLRFLPVDFISKCT